METSGSGALIMSEHSHNTHNNEIINSVFITSVSFNYSCGYILISWSREREWCCQKVQVMGINVSRRCITQLRRNMNIISDFSGYKWRHRSPQEIVQVSRPDSGAEWREPRSQLVTGHKRSRVEQEEERWAQVRIWGNEYCSLGQLPIQGGQPGIMSVKSLMQEFLANDLFVWYLNERTSDQFVYD